MIGRLFGAGTSAAELRQGLTDTTRTLRSIAHRVANASTGAPGTPGASGAGGPAGGPGSFDEALQAADAAANPGAMEPVDLETEMVRLANEQIRYDTSATLLQRVYVQLRASVRGV